ncbi:MAG: hypothetical protein LUQ22_05920, partial [Methanotrichaceae archaeon]|nr:hypothetical protein [Methanotrichaceae archaeon]
MNSRICALLDISLHNEARGISGTIIEYIDYHIATIEELPPIKLDTLTPSIVGTSTAALNIFPFAGGAILQQVSGLMLTTRSLESYQSIWLFMLICMI